MNALCSSRLLLCLMLLWAVCSVSQVQAEAKKVKLCGRDFIRAVVYTCGGSRWRRLLFPQDMEGFGEQSSIEDPSESEGLHLSTRAVYGLDDHVCCTEGCQKRDFTKLC
ncbi:insulin-like 5a [Hoplias malabaricus]|uniref:insulin-like 5a n=1 Tax=Hoplias malabaricus TaxID=27720 RepID=UPI0034622D58